MRTTVFDKSIYKKRIITSIKVTTTITFAETIRDCVHISEQLSSHIEFY